MTWVQPVFYQNRCVYLHILHHGKNHYVSSCRQHFFGQWVIVTFSNFTHYRLSVNHLRWFALPPSDFNTMLSATITCNLQPISRSHFLLSGNRYHDPVPFSSPTRTRIVMNLSLGSGLLQSWMVQMDPSLICPRNQSCFLAPALYSIALAALFQSRDSKPARCELAFIMYFDRTIQLGSSRVIFVFYILNI